MDWDAARQRELYQRRSVQAWSDLRILRRRLNTNRRRDGDSERCDDRLAEAHLYDLLISDSQLIQTAERVIECLQLALHETPASRQAQSLEHFAACWRLHVSEALAELGITPGNRLEVSGQGPKREVRQHPQAD